MDPFEAYEAFLAVRRHLNDPRYSFQRYNGHLRVNKESFLRRGDRHFFYKLSKKEDPVSYALAGLVERPDGWVTDLVGPDGDETYLRWRGRQESLVYNVGKELSALGTGLDELLQVRDGQHPLLLEAYVGKRISPETMLAVNEVTGAFRDWNRRIIDPVVWPARYLLLKKYRDFVNLGEKKDRIRKVIVDNLSGS
jgi:hypothetical protein